MPKRVEHFDDAHNAITAKHNFNCRLIPFHAHSRGGQTEEQVPFCKSHFAFRVLGMKEDLASFVES